MYVVMSLGNFSSKFQSFQKCHNDFQPLLENSSLFLHLSRIYTSTVDWLKCNSTYRDPLAK